jgi:ribosomal-protein-alanine N-acetyltransferase
MKTLRCTLTPVTEADATDLQNLYTNIKVRQYLGGPISSSQFPDKFADILNATHPQWVARLTSTNQFIGLFSLDTHHDGEGTELSYQLAEDMQGQGLAHELTSHLITHAFQTFHLPFLLAETQSRNSLSLKLLHKLGMKLEKEVERFGELQSIYKLKSSFPKLSEQTTQRGDVTPDLKGA